MRRLRLVDPVVPVKASAAKTVVVRLQEFPIRPRAAIKVGGQSRRLEVLGAHVAVDQIE